MRLAFLFVILPLLAAAQSVTISGTIFNDINNNGSRQANEPGIQGVAVSDQANVVTTDAQGRYQINGIKGYGLIMISLPDGYRTRDSFWKKIEAANQGAIDFPLIKSQPRTEFSFIHASDTHISEKSLDRMEKLRGAISKSNPDFVLITGDLVRDALRVSEKEATAYYDLFTKELQKMEVKAWCVPGNHELFGIERHLSLVSSQHPLYGRKMYRHYLGPDYYSFNYGGVHFVGLNSLEFEDLWYYGSIDSLQLEWLKKDVALLPATTPVVTFQHVPFYCGGMSISPFEEEGPGRSTEIVKGVRQFRHIVSNAQDVLAILKGHNYPIALAGHYHFQQKFTFEGVQTRFELTAAVIGPSEQGIIKMPSGITLYRVKDAKISEGNFIKLD